jgi:arylsulfatase A-like enzyme
VKDWFRNNQPVKETGYATQLWGKDAVAQINVHNPATPLFLYLAFTAPHAPYQAPQEYLDKYKHIEDPTRRAYAAMITAMDDEIGNVVAAHCDVWFACDGHQPTHPRASTRAQHDIAR